MTKDYGGLGIKQHWKTHQDLTKTNMYKIKTHCECTKNKLNNKKYKYSFLKL